jgi:hypothetical protein
VLRTLCMGPYATSVCGLKLLLPAPPSVLLAGPIRLILLEEAVIGAPYSVCGAATSVCGLKLLVYGALSY